MTYRYTLEMDEAIRYYEMVARASKDVKITQIMTLIWGPALAILILIIFNAYSEQLYIVIAVAFSLVWIIGIFPFLFRRVVYNIAKRNLKTNKSLFKEVKIDIDNSIKVDNEVKEVADFYVYFDLLIISFKDKTNLIMPERIFEGDEEKMQETLVKIIRSKEE